MVLLAPEESRENAKARAFLERVASTERSLHRVEYLGLRQSMQNGGGPACLRLRVPLAEDEANALGGRVLFSAELHDELVAWVGRHYRDRLLPKDVCDPQLARECFAALDELTRILRLGSVYDFQRA
jgi:succinylarginine dihydrolase